MNTNSNIARHGASWCVTLFSDNVSNLSRVFGLRVTVLHGLSRFVTLRHGLSRLKYPTNLWISQLCWFSTALVPKKKSIKGAFSDKHGPRFRQTWSIPTMYPNFGNIGHVSRFWIHCYFWPISRQGFSGIGKGLERKSAVFCAAFQVGLCITMPLLKQ